jgi:hypothetical protein
MIDVTFIHFFLKRHNIGLYDCITLKLLVMIKSQQHYSPFSVSARKWMITIGSIAIAATIIYAMSTGVISYLNY